MRVGEEEKPVLVGPLLPGPARDTPWGPVPPGGAPHPSGHQGTHRSGTVPLPKLSNLAYCVANQEHFCTDPDCGSWITNLIIIRNFLFDAHVGKLTI